MSVPRYKALPAPVGWDVLDLAADSKVVGRVTEAEAAAITAALNAAYDTGVADGTASERIGNAGRLRRPVNHANPCAACGHECPHYVPGGQGGARWPLETVDCAQCPGGHCTLGGAS